MLANATGTENLPKLTHNYDFFLPDGGGAQMWSTNVVNKCGPKCGPTTAPNVVRNKVGGRACYSKAKIDEK